MTLSELRTTFPELFYGHGHPEEWFRDEGFMQREPRAISPFFDTLPVRPEDAGPVYAVDLAALYVRSPDASVWRRCLWTDDTDRWGNRVYVGGVGLYGIDAFQIHRKLEPECYWVRCA